MLPACCLCPVVLPLVVVQAGVGRLGGSVPSPWCSSASRQEMHPGGSARRVRTTRGCLSCASSAGRPVCSRGGTGRLAGSVLSPRCSSASRQEMHPGGSARRVRITRGCLRCASAIRCAVLGDGGAGAAVGLGTGSSGDAVCCPGELLRSPGSASVSLLSSRLARGESGSSVLEEAVLGLLETSGLGGSVAVVHCISSSLLQLSRALAASGIAERPPE